MIHSWEERGEPELPDFDPEVDADPRNEPTAGEMLVRFLLEIFSKLSGRDFCVIMYWAWRAGVRECEEYALKPGSPSGHYMRKVKKILGWNEVEKFYALDAPGYTKHDIERSSLEI